MSKPLITPHPAGPYTVYRLFEWCMATMMVLIAVTLGMPGDTMERAALAPIARMGFSEANMAMFFGCVGAVRCTVLYLNGLINNRAAGPKGAVTRAVCAGLGALIMGQLAFALVFDAFFSNAPSFFIPVLGTLSGFEVVTVYIAYMDAVDRRTRLGSAIDRIEKALG